MPDLLAHSTTICGDCRFRVKPGEEHTAEECRDLQEISQARHAEWWS